MNRNAKGFRVIFKNTTIESPSLWNKNFEKNLELVQLLLQTATIF